MIETTRRGFQVATGCDLCRSWRVLDRAALERLREKVGGGFTLVNKRTRCRLRPGCQGWNRFHYQSGVMRPLWDDSTGDFWSARDWEAKRRRQDAAATR